MAICRMCHRTIPDGMEFCKECESKRMNQADESYLDSLLSSVSADLDNSALSVYDNVAKRVANFPSSSNIPSNEQSEDNHSSDGNNKPEELPSEDVTNFESDNSFTAEAAQPVSGIDETDSKEEFVIDAKTLETAADEFLKSLDEDPGTKGEAEELPPIADNSVADSIDALIEDASIDNNSITEISDITSPAEESVSDSILQDSDSTDSEVTDFAMPDSEEIPDVEDSVISVDESTDLSPQQEEDIDELLDSLLADMDEAGMNQEAVNAEEQINVDELSDIFAEAESSHEISEDTISEGIADISELSEESTMSDIEEIDFSTDQIDSQKLDLVDSVPLDFLQSDESDGNANLADNADISSIGLDENIGIDSVLSSIDSETQPQYLSEEDLEKFSQDKTESAEFDIDKVIDEIDSGEFDDKIKTLQVSPSSSENKAAKKPSLFQRLFGNIQLTPEEKAKEEKKEKDAEEKKQQALETKARKKEESKEQKAQRKEQEKAEKEEKAKQKAEEKRQKQEEAKEKARKRKEEKLALEEFDADEGKINRVGATILFVVFAIITVFIIVGTNIYSYNLSIKNAQEEFDIKHYNDAYYEVYGLKIQDDDIELYDKIMTVMYVNTQLNSYQYYMISNNREKALDSLLKGLQRYDKYLELATILDIKDDLNYVKSNILEQLNSEFELSEEQAYEMIEIRDDVDYSEYIYSLLGTYEVKGIE